MGFSTMQVPLLLSLPILLVASEVTQLSLQIGEAGDTYTQTVTFDFDNQVQIIEVPAHNNIVHSKSFFYFKLDKVVESHPDQRNCYLKPLPEGLVSMERFAAILGRKSASITAERQKSVHRSFASTKRIHIEAIEEMSEAFSECSYSVLYEVERKPSSFHSNRTFSQLPAETVDSIKSSLRTCKFPSSCMWQTCWIGSDSCFWTVNCPANDDECEDMIHNSDFHVNDDPITCKACFNTACMGCETAWEDGCGSGSGIGHGIKKCENGDVEEGWDCGRKRCPWPNNEKFGDGQFDCPQDKIGDGYVLSGNMCSLTCGTGRPGGYVICQEDGTWDEQGMWGCA